MAPMVPITKNGFNKLKNKLQHLKVEFEKMPARIATAREKGDLKENAEYHAAREKQGMLKANIDKINNELSAARIIDPAILPEGVINFGKTIKIKDLQSGELFSYKLVGPAESDVENGMLSINTALAKGLLGKKSGDQINISVPAGIKNYEILEVKYLPPD